MFGTYQLQNVICCVDGRASLVELYNEIISDFRVKNKRKKHKFNHIAIFTSKKVFWPRFWEP